MQNGTQIPDRTEWHNIVLWRNLAEWAEKYVKKGMKLYIEGKLQTRSWEKDGIRKSKTEIVAENVQILYRPESCRNTRANEEAEPQEVTNEQTDDTFDFELSAE